MRPAPRSDDGHKPDRSCADDDDCVAELNVSELDAVETGRHHVAHHQCVFKRHTVGNVRGVHLNVIYDVILRHHAVLTCAYAHTLTQPAGVLECAVLHL